MQRIILDTNVLVSALIQRNYPFLIVNELFSKNEIQLCLSDALLLEYYTVLKRKKFSKYPEFILRAEALLADIERKASFFVPTVTLSIIGDLSDNRLLELAEACAADFLITGNTNGFTIKSYKKTEIISPRDYFENYQRNK
ncbi:MAG: putative toxin-antitoxin system toxin component, PIN family [Mucilaginibacter sp.]